MGAALMSMGKTDEAIPAFERATTLDPKNVDALNNVGVALVGQQRGTDAIPYLENALRLKPLAPDILENYGHALHQARRQMRRLRRSRRSSNIIRTMRPVGATSAYFCIQPSVTTRPKTAFRRASRLKSHQPDVLFALGAAYHEQGKTRRLFKRMKTGWLSSRTIPMAYPTLVTAIRA